MTTKTDITLLPCPFCGGGVKETHRLNANAVSCYRCGITMRQSEIGFGDAANRWNRRADHVRDATKMVPSDAEIVALSRQMLATARTDNMIAFARALLSRYSSGQPAADLIRRMRNRLNVLASEDADMADQADAAALVAEADALLADQPVASAEADREKLMRAIVEAGQRAGIIRADLEAASVTECLHILECLSQPAASAEPVGPVHLRDGGSEIYLDGVQCRYSIERGEPWPYSDTLAYVFDPGIAERIVAALNAAPVAQEPVLVGWTVGVDGGGILHAAKYTEDEAKRAGYPLAVYRLVRPKSTPVAAQAQHAISGYTHTVPDDCETLHWRGNILSMNELASVAQPAVGEEIHIHIEGQDVLTLPLASSGMDAPRFVVHVPAQAQPIMPPLTDSMRAVLRNENDVYGDEDALYAALCDAAQAQRVVNQQMTTAASDVLADTQRAIIEAAERRGYERGLAECTQDREDADLLDWLREETCDLRCINEPTGGDDYDVRWIVIRHHMAKPHEREIGRSFTDDPRDAIRAARAEEKRNGQRESAKDANMSNGGSNGHID